MMINLTLDRVKDIFSKQNSYTILWTWTEAGDLWEDITIERLGE